jgi:hypothetical protein
MKFIFLSFLITFSATGAVKFKAEFPQGPESDLTPGRLCDRPDSYRYPERIAYCNRAVDPMLKDDVFREYRENGYRLDLSKRDNYKIDHLIPLCAGGSNAEDNLWPQHISIFSKTDPMESLGCEKLKQGKIRQADLVNLIISAKKNLSLLPKTIIHLQRL